MKKDYNFGYTKVNSKQKTKLVQNVFSSVAPSYDIMNDLMSLGMHRLWKKRFVETVDLKENEIILDVGSGSGDIAIEILKENLPTSLYLLDLLKTALILVILQIFHTLCHKYQTIFSFIQHKSISS